MWLYGFTGRVMAATKSHIAKQKLQIHDVEPQVVRLAVRLDDETDCFSASSSSLAIVGTSENSVSESVSAP
jgi:hypothetical protein